MGFLSDVWKGIKDVFKGVLKVFEPILKPLGKLMNSSFGKALMIGLSIFTLGSAMVAGYGVFSANMAAGNGFIQSFVQGGKEFLTALTGLGEGGTMPTPDAPASQLQNVAAAQTEMTGQVLQGGGAPELAGQGGLQGGGALTEGAQMGGAPGSGMEFGPGVTGDQPMRAVTGGVEGRAGGGILDAPGAPPPGTGDAGMVEALKTPTQSIQSTGETGNWLTRAAKSAGDWMATEGGGQIVGSVISGVGNYYTEKDRQEFEDRIRRQWMKGEGDPGVRGIREQGARLGRLPMPSAQDIARQSRTTAREGGGRPTFERAYGAGAGG